MKKLGSLLFLSILSSYSYAEYFDIVRVGVDLSQQTFFIGVVQQATSSPCAVKNEFKWSLSASGVKEIETMAIAAKLAGKRVVIGVDTVNCVVGQATGSFLYID